jgi:hypothetical protein
MSSNYEPAIGMKDEPRYGLTPPFFGLPGDSPLESHRLFPRSPVMHLETIDGDMVLKLHLPPARAKARHAHLFRQGSL